jgi:hypothetical protein
VARRRFFHFKNMASRDRSPERPKAKQVHLVLSVTIRSWKSVERELPLAFSSLAKAETYCAREAGSWTECTRQDNFTWTGETYTVDGDPLQRSVQIVPVNIDASDPLFVVKYTDTGKLEDQVIVNGAKGAIQYMEAEVGVHRKKGIPGWKHISPFYWRNKATNEAYKAKRVKED